MSDNPNIQLRDEERTRCEVWTRVMGYHRPVAAFNAGKRSEHQERRYFVEQRRSQAPGGLKAQKCN
ncbi:MAG: anaerobic ribonucleoside-triphosphate reductase [Chromatiaceae bacterium]